MSPRLHRYGTEAVCVTPAQAPSADRQRLTIDGTIHAQDEAVTVAERTGRDRQALNTANQFTPPPRAGRICGVRKGLLDGSVGFSPFPLQLDSELVVLIQIRKSLPEESDLQSIAGPKPVTLRRVSEKADRPVEVDLPGAVNQQRLYRRWRRGRNDLHRAQDHLHPLGCPLSVENIQRPSVSKAVQP